MTYSAKVIQMPAMSPQPLVGAERDEIAAMVMRLKRADERTRTSTQGGAATTPLPAENLKWAEDWKLPREVFDFFELEHAS
ncbi:MAG: hypothetical protein DI585_05940 [Pseudomonas fluorescens]|nr:MAG: hypothetical protein DI585_05940 [Pseudomonas fluorescens]